ncbi:UNVERIFIED_CONTAM: hypothetical protein POZ17_15755 [Ralstonia mannitolilytica]
MRKIISLLVIVLLIGCKKHDPLLAMNNVKMPEYEELIHNISSSDTLRILILGNSISSHGISTEIGWNHKAGMAASDESKDYVHLLFKRLVVSKPQKNVIVRFSNYSLMERNPESFLNKEWKSLIVFEPNKVIFQLSDNVTKDKVDSFKESSLQLLGNFKTSNIYVVSPFFVNEENYKTSKEIAINSKATFIDISDIAKSSQNKAINEKNYPASKNSWIVDGIGQHPGNIGMLNISTIIYNHVTLIDSTS